MTKRKLKIVLFLFAQKSQQKAVILGHVLINKIIYKGYVIYLFFLTTEEIVVVMLSLLYIR